MEHHTYLLDGDDVHHCQNKHRGFDDVGRVENIRHFGGVAELMTDAGLIVITAFISPFRSDRQMVREMFADGGFVEEFVDTPLEIADPRGLHAKARTGQIASFTGIDSPYERLQAPEVRLDAATTSVEGCVELLLEALTAAGS